MDLVFLILNFSGIVIVPSILTLILFGLIMNESIPKNFSSKNFISFTNSIALLNRSFLFHVSNVMAILSFDTFSTVPSPENKPEINPLKQSLDFFTIFGILNIVLVLFPRGTPNEIKNSIRFELLIPKLNDLPSLLPVHFLIFETLLESFCRAFFVSLSRFLNF